MSEQDQAQPETEVTEPVVEKEEATTEGEDQPESKEPEAKEPEEEAKKPEPKDEKTEADKRAERKAYNQQKAWERLVEEKAMLKAKVELYEQQTAQQQKSQASGRPARDSYGSDEDYVDALTDWKLEQKFGTYKEELTRTQSTSKIQDEWVSKISKARQDYPDYDDVLADSREHHVNPEVVEVLQSSDLGGDVTYYLAKHLDELEKLNGMDSLAVARYVGRLEEKIGRERSSIKSHPVSKAPAPIKPASPSSASSIKSLEDMSMEEYVKYMDKQDALKRKR